MWMPSPHAVTTKLKVCSTFAIFLKLQREEAPFKVLAIFSAKKKMLAILGLVGLV
jgi:hypothetical protein